MKEGQTQEPVGGMEELTDKFIQTMTGNCEHEAYCQREDCKWKGMVVCCTVQNEAMQCAKIAFEYFAPPSAPIKTEGEDEWKDKFIDWLCHELRGTTPSVIERIVDHVERYVRPSSAPPSPVGIDVLKIVDTLNDWVNENNRETIPRKAFLEISKTIAGYTASLPQSSTEEEKELWEEVANVLYGFEMDMRFDINELLSTYKISKK